jgi:PAS domain S-box-containing protein
MRRTAQLASIKSRLEDETRLRKMAEEKVTAEKPRLHLIDESLSVMIALVDTDLCYQYHNRAFRNWTRLRPEQINGQTMRKVLGAKVYADMENAVRQSLQGQSARYRLTQTMPDGATYPLSIEHVPQFAGNGKVTGFYFLAADVAERGDTPPGSISHDNITANTAHGHGSEQDMFVHSFTEQIIGQKDAVNRIISAIEKDEFHLYGQLITPLAVASAEAGHYEILVRLQGEEDNMMPPGAFFPLAEKYGLMPHLDRWVVQHVTEWISNKNLQGTQQEGSIFFINIASDTINDPEFPKFLQEQLLKYGVSATALCFEISGISAIAGNGAVHFAEQARQCGCHVALSGFGREGVSFDLLKRLRVDFLKIDGSIILHIQDDPIYLAKVSAISQVAKKIGVKTIAELVESESIIAKLRELGIDSAQGFGISRPLPLAEIGLKSPPPIRR